MLEHIKYNKDFQNAYSKSTVELSPVQEILNTRYKAITYTRKVFNLYPQLFNGNGSTLFYTEYAGSNIKHEILYLQFESFVTASSRKIIQALLDGNSIYAVEVNNLIAWARYIQQTGTLYVYEPVMRKCTNVLDMFLSTNSFIHGNRTIKLTDIENICYTNVGENICYLLPYIAYIFNFFINCNHYCFNEIATGSTTNYFMDAVNANFSLYYSKLLKECNGMTLEQLFSCPERSIELFDPSTLMNMFNEMCNPQNIIEIRNKIISKNKELLELSNSQDVVTDDVVAEGFYNVLNNLIDIVINKNPITTSLFNKIPTFDTDINYYELSLLTEYTLSGGTCPFIVNSDESYSARGDPQNVKHYNNIPCQKLETSVNKLHITTGKPFTSSDFALQTTTAYIRNEFTDKQNDILNDNKIVLSKDFIYTQKYGKDFMHMILVSLYVNGKWSCDSTSMCKVFKILSKHKSFINEIIGILNLAFTYKLFFDNDFGANIIPAYILSFLNEWVLKFMTRDSCGNINKFSPMIYFCLNHKFDDLRVKKLINMEKSVMLLHNKSYTNFVNSNAREFLKILTYNSFISQPYVKSISDNIDMYLIGGCELVQKSQYGNPLVRGYWFMHSTQGNCEYLEAFYNWIRYIDNSTAFELLETAIKQKDYLTIIKILENTWKKMVEKNNVPIMLLNYEYMEDGSYKIKPAPYFITLKLGDGNSLLSVICQNVFPLAHAKNVMSNEIYTRPICYNNGVFTTQTPLKNHIKYGKKIYPISLKSISTSYTIPYLNFNAEMKEFDLAFAQPDGYRLIPIIMDSSRQEKNNTMFVFTSISTLKFAGKNFVNDFSNIYDNKTDFKNDGAPVSRMLITGLNKKAIPDVSVGNA